LGAGSRMMTNSKDEDRDATHSGMPPLPGSNAAEPQAKPPSGETDPGLGQPVLPGQKPRAASPSPPEPEVRPAGPQEADADSPTVIADEDLEATIIGEVTSPYSLVHLKPPGHPTPIKLTQSSYVVGRSRGCDVLLFSATAHRRHAKLLQRDEAWVLEPIENNVVIANGDLVRGEVQLVHKMRLQFGDDEFAFFDERKAARPPGKEAEQATRSGRHGGNILLAAAVLAIAVAAFFLWWGQ